MKKTYLVLMTLGLALVMSSLGWAAMDWQIVYQTDFATDQGWHTNNPDNYYLDCLADPGPTGAYNGKMFNINYGGEYAYYDVPQTTGSFRLNWDMMVKSPLQYAAGLSFGLYSEGLESSKPPSNFAEITFGSEDRGNLIFLNWSDTDGYGRDYSLADPFKTDTWYKLRMEYDGKTKLLTAFVTSPEGTFELSCTNVGPFDSDMAHLGISNVRDGEFQRPGNWGEGNIDNIVFEVPEPATVLLVGLGGLLLRRRGR